MSNALPGYVKPLKLLALYWVLTMAVTSHAAGPDARQKKDNTMLQSIGHRGAAGLAPENTLAAFGRALEFAVDALELDVHLSADGRLVVHHDFHLNPDIARTPDGKWINGKGPAIKNLTVAQLKAYDVGRLKPNTAYAKRYPEQTPADGERIPTFAEVIDLLKRRSDGKTQLWIEIKTSPEEPASADPPEPVADALLTILRKENLIARTRILSFDWHPLVHIQKIAPGIPTVYLSRMGVSLNNIKPGQPGVSPWTAGIDVDDYNGSIPQAVKAAGGRCWGPYYRELTADLLDEAHRLGLAVSVWTIDKQSDMVRLMDMKVDAITTNRPDILQSVLGKR